MKNIASAGNRTRASRVAGENSTTEPPMLINFLFIHSLNVKVASCAVKLKLDIALPLELPFLDYLIGAIVH